MKGDKLLAIIGGLVLGFALLKKAYANIVNSFVYIDLYILNTKIHTFRYAIKDILNNEKSGSQGLSYQNLRLTYSYKIKAISTKRVQLELTLIINYQGNEWTLTRNIDVVFEQINQYRVDISNIFGIYLIIRIG